jgi:hypothetical protein
MGRFLMATAMLAGSGESECQQPGGEETAPADAMQESTVREDSVRDGCRSVVLVECAQTQQEAAPADAPDGSLEAAKRKLEERRLRQKQAQAGLNAIEVTSALPPAAETDPWEGFRQSVTDAAVPSCFSQDAVPFAQGLLRLPVLLGAAAIGKCR